MKILAVDDDPFILELLPLLAEKAGFPDVTTAQSGHLALGLLADTESEFECFLLDITMPGMDGIELCSRVRKIDAYRRTPIIMLTAMSERKYMDKAFKAGATDYATKPFDIIALGARLRMARELVQVYKRGRVANELRADAAPARGQHHAFDLAEALVLDDAEALIDFESLKNYLKQSARAGHGALQVIAIKVDGIAVLYDRASRDEFFYALRDVADALSVALLTKESLISYAGGGMFVAIAGVATTLVSTEIEADVQHLLDEKSSEFDSGAPMDIEVSVGNAVQPNLSEISDVAESIDRAISHAESRESTKRNAPREVGFHRSLK
jgi:DNA-binding response OmpR family regulator